MPKRTATNLILALLGLGAGLFAASSRGIALACAKQALQEIFGESSEGDG